MASGQTNYNRRYVNVKETATYVMFDSSKSFNIDQYVTRFIVDVLKIDLDLNSLIGIINGIWDIINDSFIGAMVDRTSTRFGKFRPYLIGFAIPGTLATCVYWMAPLFFDENPYSMAKFFFWLILAMLRSVGGTFRTISETGLLSTITPNPNDRVGLYTKAEVISSIWESLPEMTMGILIDLVNHNKVGFSMQTAYVTMGVGCTLVGGLLAIFFAIFAKERIMQSEEKPSYREGLQTILRNRPMLMIMLSELLGAFSISTGEQNYYIDVLGSASYRNIVMLPGAPLSFLSYSYFPWIRSKISTKANWIIGQHLKDACSVVIFLVGSIGGKGTAGLYRKPAVMLPILMAKDMLYKGTLAMNKIPPREIITDALDYCEWKNGFRTEGVTLATKGMITKIIRVITGSLTTFIMKRVGYSLTAGFGQQSDHTKYSLFSLCMVLPVATGALAVIPKLFYDLSGEKRERMYAELSEMRALKRRDYDAKQAQEQDA